MLEAGKMKSFVEAYWGVGYITNDYIDDVVELTKEKSESDFLAEDETEYSFPTDGLIIRPVIKGKIDKRTWISIGVLLVLLPIVLYINAHFYHGQKYLMFSLIVVTFATVPFLLVFEGRKPKARELMVIAVMAAIGVAGRGIFYFLPNMKPVAAVIIISGVSLGPESGFLVACVTMLVSNMMFGQGPWTPWQMFAYGIIGALAGILFQKGKLKPKKLSLCIYAFLAEIFIFGGIMNPAAVLMSYGQITLNSILTFYISGIPVDLARATATILFMFFISRPLLEKLERVKKKYGLCERQT